MSLPPEFDLEVHEDPVQYVYFDLNGAGKAVTQFSAVLHGWSLSNPSAGVAATLNIYDGTDTSGTAIIPLSLATSESVGDWFGDRGVLLKNGIYVNVTAGEVKGSIFFRHVRR